MTRARPQEIGDLGGRLLDAATLSRRRFVGGMGAGIAAMAAAACAKPPRQDMIPYVRRPREVTPGVPNFYATSTTRAGYGFGLIVESHEGRPTKIEGHPEHPASLGGTGAREQASIWTLYDPDRAQFVRNGSERRNFHDFVAAFGIESTKSFVRDAGAGLKLVLRPSASPLRAWLVDELRERYPKLSLSYYAPSSPLARWQGARRALGDVLEPQYRFDAADVIVALDADFLGNHPMSASLARRFAERRKITRPDDPLNRLYVVESGVSVTGAAAEHRLAVPTSEIGAVAAALCAAVARELGDPDSARLGARSAPFLERSPHRRWLESLARDLARHHGRAAVLVGDRQPSEVHVLGHALNAALGAFGNALAFSPSPMPNPGGTEYDVAALLDELEGGRVDALFLLDVNPVYDLPPDAQFVTRAHKAAERIELGLYENETSAHATWFLPKAHFLEHWGDERAFDGTVSFVQPLIEPLYGGKSVDEVLAVLSDGGAAQGRRLFEAYWGRRLGAAGQVDVDAALAHGLLPNSVASVRTNVRMDWGAAVEAVDGIAVPRNIGLEIDFFDDPRGVDEELSNNPWLKELPEPITKTVWGNVALVAPGLARRTNIETGDVVVLATGDREVELPAFVQPGQAEGAVSVWLGYGRSDARSVARGIGVDVGPIRSLGAPWSTSGATLRKTNRRERVVVTQTTASLHGRPVVLRKTLEEWKREPGFTDEYDEPPLSILPERLHGSPQWGMTIDLNACTGCSACVVACQSENNVPVVGKDDVFLSREMHWIRIDRYYGGTDAAPVIDVQPMLCQHCEKAPCEYVCPVNATVHSPDGLNEMVYNRCVGTRFCSNNCPYKVRRFNFWNYNNDTSETERMGKNPDVTVRGRGVMEKCTYCVQRIRRAEIDARVERRAIRDGEVRTACEQACPTGAIVFGNVADPAARVRRLYENPRTYAALNDVGTRPRTRYLARITNSNPEIES